MEVGIRSGDFLDFTAFSHTLRTSEGKAQSYWLKGPEDRTLGNHNS